jgi:hypothetical protein
LVEVHYGERIRQLHLGPAPESRPATDAGYSLEMRVMVEPRMLIRADGPLKELQVSDDRGQSLLGSAENQNGLDFGFTSAAYILVDVPLRPLDRPGKVIRSLSGLAPVVVAARRPDPLEIPLAGAAGRSFHGVDSVVTIREIKPISEENERGGVSIEITPIPDERAAEGQSRPGRKPRGATGIELTIRAFTDARLDPSDFFEDQFEVIDGQGRLWRTAPWWMSGGGPRGEGREIRVRLKPVDRNLAPWSGELAGARLRYYGGTVARVGVRFEFRDVPMP